MPKHSKKAGHARPKFTQSEQAREDARVALKRCARREMEIQRLTRRLQTAIQKSDESLTILSEWLDARQPEPQTRHDTLG